MHAKTGISWVILGNISLYIKFFDNISKEIWKFPGTSISLERISSFSTSVNISFDSVVLESWGETFFQKLLLSFTDLTSRFSKEDLFDFFKMLTHLFLC